MQGKDLEEPEQPKIFSYPLTGWKPTDSDATEIFQRNVQKFDNDLIISFYF